MAKIDYRMITLLKEVFKRVDTGEAFFLGITRYYLEGEEYSATGLTLASDSFDYLNIEEDHFSGIFYFPNPLNTIVKYSDIWAISQKGEYLYHNNSVIKSFLDEMEKSNFNT